MGDTITEDVKYLSFILSDDLLLYVLGLQIYLVHIQSVYLLIVHLSLNNPLFVWSHSGNCKSNSSMQKWKWLQINGSKINAGNRRRQKKRKTNNTMIFNRFQKYILNLLRLWLHCLESSSYLILWGFWCCSHRDDEVCIFSLSPACVIYQISLAYKACLF